MDIHNNIDGKGLKATNFADGTADTDLATVGQLGGGGGGSTVYGGLSGSDDWNYLSDGSFRLDQTSVNIPMQLSNCTVPSYPLTVSITSFADNGSGGTTCTAVSHGLAENDTLQFSFNGISIHRIFNITTNTFDIGTAYTASPTSATAKILTVIRTSTSGKYLINFTGFITIPDISSNPLKYMRIIFTYNGNELMNNTSQSNRMIEARIDPNTGTNLDFVYFPASISFPVVTSQQNNSFCCMTYNGSGQLYMPFFSVIKI